MIKSEFVRIGDQIVNLAHIRLIDVLGDDGTTLYVHLDNGEELQFLGDKGRALLAALSDHMAASAGN